MAQSLHDQIADLHGLAGHTHFAAAVAHRKKDHLAAQKLSEKAYEYSASARKYSEELAEKGL